MVVKLSGYNTTFKSQQLPSSELVLKKPRGETSSRIWNMSSCWWQLCLRGRASILLSEGHRFNSPGLHLAMSLGQILNPKQLLMCWSAPCMSATRHQYMYEVLCVDKIEFLMKYFFNVQQKYLINGLFRPQNRIKWAEWGCYGFGEL